MNITSIDTGTINLSVAEIAITYPHALSTLTMHNIDFCCGGKKSFKEVCEKKGLNPEIILKEITKDTAGDNQFHLRFSTWGIPLLVDYIVQNHHAYVKGAVAELQELLDKVYSVHGEDHIELAEIRTDFNNLSEELLTHMQKEEKFLFPALMRNSMETKTGQTFSHANLESPIRAMEGEHELAGDLIKSIRQLTQHYTIPRNACPTLTLTYKKLEEFDRDLMQHIHVENNVLFEKAKSLA